LKTQFHLHTGEFTYGPNHEKLTIDDCLLDLLALWSGGAVSAAPFSQDFNGSTLDAGWIFESPNAASSMSFTGSALKHHGRVAKRRVGPL